MSTVQKPAEPRYPVDGARDLLRVKLGELSISEMSNEARDALFSEAALLVKEVAEFMKEYGYQAKATDDPHGAFWTFSRGSDSAMCIRPRLTFATAFQGFRPNYFGPQSLEFKPDLYWDTAERKWYGPYVGQGKAPDWYVVRDFQKEGAPKVRMSALEAMVKAILEALK